MICPKEYVFQTKYFKYDYMNKWIENNTYIVWVQIRSNRTLRVRKNWNRSTCACENGTYLGSVINDSVVTWNEIINAVDRSTDVTSTRSENFHNEIVRYKMGCYILPVVLLVVILRFMIAIICYHFAKHSLKPKTIGTLIIQN